MEYYEEDIKNYQTSQVLLKLEEHLLWPLVTAPLGP